MWHLAALSGRLPPLSSLLLSSGKQRTLHTTTPESQERQGTSDDVSGLRHALVVVLDALLQQDAFGLTPVQRAFQCWRLEPMPLMQNTLRHILATRMLLAVVVGRHLLSSCTMAFGKSCSRQLTSKPVSELNPLYRVD